MGDHMNTQTKKIRCIALDFDYTISHFTDNLDGLFDIVVRHGIDSKHARDIFTTVVENTGFTFEKYFEALQETGLVLPRLSILRPEFDAWLSRSLVLYEDSLATLQKWRNKAPIIIVTSGNPSFQKEKIAASNIPIDLAKYVKPPQQKIHALKDIIITHGAPIIFADDNPRELDAVYQSHMESDIITIRMLRLDTPYETVASQYPHTVVRSLKELDEKINIKTFIFSPTTP